MVATAKKVWYEIILFENMNSEYKTCADRVECHISRRNILIDADLGK